MANGNRPLGVAIIAILIGIFGFFTVIGGILLLAGSTVGLAFGVPGFLGLTGFVLGVIVLIVGLLLLAVAYGLWDLRMWALALAVIVLIFELVANALAGAFLSLGFIVSLLLLIYLIAVSRHFS
jgi:hypothetical protein